MKLSATIKFAAAAAMLGIGGGVSAQYVPPQWPGLSRAVLLHEDISIPGRETYQIRVDFQPRSSAGRHRHPGEELVYVLEGEREYQLDGRPPVTLRAGDALFIPAGFAHAVRNVGSGRGSELGTYIVEKCQPLVVPAS